MNYAYSDPRLHKWIPGFSTRDTAALAMLRAHPVMRGGFTAPVLTEDRGIVVPEHNSIVHFTRDGRVFIHNHAQLMRARIK